MPWRMAATVSDMRRGFLTDHARGVPLHDLMSAYDIKKSAAYELLKRARTMPINEAVAVQSRAPLRRPTKIPDEVIERVLKICGRYPGFGPKKIFAKLEELFDETPPSQTSIGSMMKAHDTVDETCFRECHEGAKG